MKTFFYPRLAWDGIRKNKRMVFPYMLTCICMISMFYILAFLASDSTVALLPRGKDNAQLIMTLGCIVIAVFSTIFLYYTNSFLIRRRAAEFGLYNVLGMNKRNIVRIITHETRITSAISIVIGLFAGITFSKLAELGLVRMIGGDVNFSLRIVPGCAIITVIVYLAIFALIWLSSVIRVGRSSTVSLLQSEKAGEKAPKSNWLLGILGTAILAAAYYIAVSINNPIEAILWFFLAVIMVIIATYLLMIAGSVLLCRILQKNKKYYYDPRHFVSVSSMIYRMKRNGAGLASIAIIATMVLVMISSASCLWFGTEKMLENRFPGDVNYTVSFYDAEAFCEENLDTFRKIMDDFETETDSETETVLDLHYLRMEGLIEGNTLDFGNAHEEFLSINKFREVCFIPLSVYNRMTDQDIRLDAGEAIAFSSSGRIDSDTVNLIMDDLSMSYRLVRPDAKELYADNSRKDVITQITLVISDPKEVDKIFGVRDERAVGHIWLYSFDVKRSAMSNLEYARGARNAINNVMKADTDPERIASYSIWAEERDVEGVDLMSANGSLFFIGIILSVVFIFAAVLIIYYKQISEGYEDYKRFEVMRKVGMTGKEIRKSINSQLLVVFFIPLAFAGVHLAFAFPMIGKILNLFGLYNKSLFLITTLISFGVFAVFYTIVYKVTSNVYYRIVSDAK